MLTTPFAVTLLVLGLAVLTRGHERIVGGTETTTQMHPYMFQLEFANIVICGATLVTRTWILTAAHCLEPYFYFLYKVRGGNSKCGVGVFLSSLTKIVVHEQYTNSEDIRNQVNVLHNDIAMMKMATEINVSPLFSIRPAWLPYRNTDYPPEGSLVTVVGWGQTNEDGSPSHGVRQVMVPVVLHEVCATACTEIRKSVFCAGYMNEGRKDSCIGDSDGPALINGTLVGIVSYGKGCARPEYPGVYTRVTFFMEWIFSIIGDYF